MTANTLDALLPVLRRKQRRLVILTLLFFVVVVAIAIAFRGALMVALVPLAASLMLQPLAGLVQRDSPRLSMVLLRIAMLLIALASVLLVRSIIVAS